MAANKFAQYVWLLDLIRKSKRITLKEINQKWLKSSLSYGRNLDLQERTFHNHRKAIEEIFGISIKCDIQGGYKYYIEDQDVLERDSMHCWLLDSFSVLNQIKGDVRLKDRIIFEQVPSGQNWLHPIIEAIREKSVINITHRGFDRPEPNNFDIEPYYLKVLKRRWYVIARNPYYSERNKRKNKEDKGHREENVYMIYALDRIEKVQETGGKFTMNEDFNIDEFFRGCCGVIRTGEAPVRVVIRAYNRQPDYIRSLPLHESQVEIASDEESTLFEYYLRPNLEFYQMMLGQADQIEIVEPQSVREEMRNFCVNLMSYYNKENENE